MKLDPDNSSNCIDIDECAESNGTICSQVRILTKHVIVQISYNNIFLKICTNMIGNYNCSCAEGYTLVGKAKCKINNGPAKLIFSTKAAIQGINLYSAQNKTPFMIFNDSSQISKAIAVNFDVGRKIIFWTDVVKEAICFEFIAKYHNISIVPYSFLEQSTWMEVRRRFIHLSRMHNQMALP